MPRLTPVTDSDQLLTKRQLAPQRRPLAIEPSDVCRPPKRMRHQVNRSGVKRTVIPGFGGGRSVDSVARRAKRTGGTDG
jgi:hypothetical protein